MSARGRPAMSMLDDDDDTGDVVNVQYRFSAMAVRRVVDVLSPEEEELIRSIGFGGMLHLTRYGKLDRHFSAWIVNQLVTAAPAPGVFGPVFLADGADAEVPVTSRDVHEVLGVPIGEQPTDGDTAAVRRALGNMQPTLPVAEAVLGQRKARASAGPMTQSERDSFVVAFVIFVVGHFLAPAATDRREKVNADIFHALANPSEVRLFNWADYVLQELRRCAVRVRQQVADGCPKILLSGCLLFLQILYLDRLDLAAAGCGEPRRREVQPRVAAFSNETLHQLIELDRKPEWREGGLKQFGKLKFIVARLAQTVDSGSSSKGLQPCLNSSDSAQHENTNMDEVMDEFECFKFFLKMKNRSGMLSKLLNDSPCSAGSNKGAQHQPFSEQVLPGSNASCQHQDGPLDLHLTPRRLADSNILNSIRCNVNTGAMIFPSTDAAKGNHPDTVGFDPANSAPRVVSRSTNKEICANLQPKTKSEIPSKKRSQQEFPSRKGTKCASYHDVIQAVSPSLAGQPLIQGTSCQTNSDNPKDLFVIDTDSFESEAWCAPSSKSTKIMTNDNFGHSTFDMKLFHPKPPRKEAEACFKWLGACSNADDQLSWTWVIHEEPTSIRVAGARIKPQMLCGGDLQADVCNLVMRLYNQLDEQIYQNSGTRDPRWRHFLPADWALLALQHGSNICKSSPAVVSMFSGAHITYDVELCRMVIAPVELEGAWSCYVWDFMEKQLSILDPLLGRRGGNESVIRSKHSRAAPLLLDALLACRSQYCNSRGYGDQESNPNSWVTNILKNFGGTRTF